MMSRMVSRVIAAGCALATLLSVAGCAHKVDMEALPRDMSWKVYQGQPYPVSPLDGPVHTSAALPWG